MEGYIITGSKQVEIGMLVNLVGFPNNLPSFYLSLYLEIFYPIPFSSVHLSTENRILQVISYLKMVENMVLKTPAPVAIRYQKLL